MFKKRLLLLPVLIISVLLSCVSFSASATTYQFTAREDNPEITDEELLSRCELCGQDPQNYITFYCVQKNPFRYSDDYGQIYQYIRSMFIFNTSNLVNASENNGVYTFTTSPYFNYHCYGYTSYENSDCTYQDIRNMEWVDYEAGNTIVYDSNNDTISVDCPSIYSSNCEFFNVKFHMGDLHYDPQALNLEVIFNPPLNSSISRSSTSNGISSVQSSFTMDITNNGSVGAQYLMCVSEPGYAINDFNSVGNLPVGSSFCIKVDNNCKFFYLSDETVYLSQVNAFKSVVTSPWHLCPSGTTSHVEFLWSMLDLVPNHNYDVTVYALINNGDCVSTIALNTHGFVIPDLDNDVRGKYSKALDFDSVKEVYRSTFSIVDPATYDPNTSYGGVIPNNSDFQYSHQCSIIKGVFDENGKYKAIEYDALRNGAGYYTGNDIVSADKSPFAADYSSYYEQFNDDFKNSGYTYDYTPSNSSYSSLLSRVSVVFSFFGSVLGYFPTDVVIVFNLGLWSMIIILILRRLR